jgi:hypothetical protein
MSETLSTETPSRSAARKASVNRLDPNGTSTVEAEAKPVARELAREPIPHGRAVALDRDGNPIYRRRDNTEDMYHVPEELKEQGWDYQWNRVSVLGQEDTGAVINDRENGWRPISASREGFAGRFMPDGHKGPIQRGGLELCERPMALSLESRREDRQNANAQRRHNRQQFGLPSVPEGFDDSHPSLNRFGKGKPGVKTDFEGAPRAEGKYQMAIDE